MYREFHIRNGQLFVRSTNKSSIQADYCLLQLYVCKKAHDTNRDRKAKKKDHQLVIMIILLIAFI